MINNDKGIYNGKRLYKSYFFERYFMLHIVGIPIFIFIIFCYLQVEDKGYKHLFSISEWKEYIYNNDMLVYMYLGIVFVLIFFLYSYVITDNCIEKRYLISVWRNKKVDIHDIVFIEFEVVSGYGGSFFHFFIHTKKDIIELECPFSYRKLRKLYDAFKKLGVEINVRQEIAREYPKQMKKISSEGMDIRVNPLLEEKYLRMKK